MIDRTLGLGLSAALAHTIGYWLFIGQIRRKETVPNLATWIVWCALVALSACIYKDITGSYIRSAQYFVGIVGSFIVCIYALHGSRRDKLTHIERRVMYACLAALTTWFIFGNVTIAGAITIAAIAVSAIPTIARTAKNPGTANSAPWLWWSIGFVATMINGYLAPRADPLKVMIPAAALCVDVVIIALLMTPHRRRTAPTRIRPAASP